MVKKNAICYDKTQHANFRGKPLFQTTKPLKPQLNSENSDAGYAFAFG